ncbi:hypothetical protein [Cryobacterium sp. TMT4-31]|uniref:hypothetical protein n=1 Tax=Cryobacterium sp. TMT4-31 TaxID=1259259 RepID=UPI00106AC9E4|nr:hypothetical protein [Cryobacterium sp. TMT4-31]TFC90551.1 hypothetical protein E3T19_05415 [Cryobacterium sp. TMT4-31]
MSNPTDFPRRSENAAKTYPVLSEGMEGDLRVTRPRASTQEKETILADARRRDDEADLRDVEADKRAEAADLQASLDTDETHTGPSERRAAALDRSHAKSDRESSAADRAQLSKLENSPD